MLRPVALRASTVRYVAGGAHDEQMMPGFDHPALKFSEAIRSMPSITLRWFFVEPGNSLLMREITQTSPLVATVVMLSNAGDDILAGASDFPEAREVMRWAAEMTTPMPSQGIARYAPVILRALRVRRLLLIETPEERLPSWQAMWAAVKAESR